MTATSASPDPSREDPSRLDGLSSAEARRRLQQYGVNELERREGTPAWRLLLDQFTSPLILLLMGGSVVSALVGHLVDASAILVIVSINAVVGFGQEYRAEQAVLALRNLTAARAKVVRDGRLCECPAREVVPGDLLVLEAGDLVAADARLLEAHELTAIESMLTGESVPVRKSAEPVPDEAPLAERTDSVFMGTSIATGVGKARVENTAMNTEMGNIAHLLSAEHDDTTPLQQRLSFLGKILLYICLILVAVTAALGLWRGQGWLDVLMTSVSLAVAAVPEGLPAVVTVALAVGVRRMSARNVLIRKLSAVETLGSATIICTDKTGTLTTGVMTLREVWGERRAALDAAAACCDAELDARGEGGTGDPTELAILRAAAAEGIHREDIERARPRVSERPFDAERRRMSIIREDGVAYVKGAAEAVVPLCVDGTEGVQEASEAMARRGLRVLAVAIGRDEEKDLKLVGLLGIADAPRPEAIEAVARARGAGIKVVMITGDHPLTAHAIAREMGIVGDGEDPEGLVFARKTARDKTEIVRAFLARGEIVAMTGDGVNDAPSIREAHIGIAMGQTATEVTREASEMILTDDDLSGVVAAIREGRIIYANIRKTIVYLLSGNGSELVFMLIAAAMGLPLPLTPLQLLWVNMMTEPLPGLALAVDPEGEDVLEKPPRSPDEPIMGRAQWAGVLAVAAVHSIVVLAVFIWALPRGLEEARTLAFSSFVFGVLFRSFAARSPEQTFWEVGALGNLKLLVVVAISVGLQVGIQSFEWSRGLFAVSAPTVPQLGLALALGLIPVTVVELYKLARRGVRWARSFAGSRAASLE